MWYAHQTLLHKQTRKLWVIAQNSDSAWAWAWVGKGSTPMLNESGEVHGFKGLSQVFTHVADEFGEPLPGNPIRDECRKIIGPDISLYQFVNMTEEEKEPRRQRIIAGMVEEFKKRFDEWLVDERTIKYQLPTSIPGYNNHYRRDALFAMLRQSFEDYFDCGPFGHYFVFRGRLCVMDRCDAIVQLVSTSHESISELERLIVKLKLGEKT